MSALQKLHVEFEHLSERQAAVEGEMEELEIVSWQDKLQLEQQQQHKLSRQIHDLKVKGG